MTTKPRASGSLRIVAVVLLVSTMSSASVMAQTPDRCVDSIDESRVSAYRARAEADVRRVARRGRAWFLSWTVVNAFFLGAGIYVARTVDDRAEREVAIWGAAGSGLGLAMLYAPPLPSIYAPRRIRRGVAAGLDDRARLELALSSLRHGAEFERSTSAPYWHAVNGVYVTVESLVLGLRHRDDVGLVVLNGVASLAITESQLISTPHAARRAMRDLERDGIPCATESHPAEARGVTLRLAGLGILGTF